MIMGITLLTLIALMFGFLAGYFYMKFKKDEYIKHLVYDCKIDSALSELEKTKIKEVRLITKGHMYCQGQCGRVAGMFYKYPDGSIRGITLRSIKSNDKGKSKSKLICEDCIAESMESMRQAERYVKSQEPKKVKVGPGRNN